MKVACWMSSFRMSQGSCHLDELLRIKRRRPSQACDQPRFGSCWSLAFAVPITSQNRGG